MKLQEVTSYNLKSQNILNESWQELTESQRLFMGKAERELWPLMEQLTKVLEATLTPDQIKAIFQNAETVAMSGDNRTKLAKVGSALKLPVDIMKKINAKVDELGRMAQKAGPVQNLDAKIEQLKSEIDSKDSKVVQGIRAVSDWAKANPKKASLAVAILTAAAAFATGPAGGAAVGFLLRSTKGMLQGEKLSTAVGKAAKTAAVGALAGVALDNLGDVVLDNFAAASEAEIEGMIQDFKDVNLEIAMNNIDPELQALFPELEDAQRFAMSGSINQFYYNYDIIFTPELLEEYESLKLAVDGSETFSDEFYQNSAKLHDWLAGVQDDLMQEQYKSAIEALRAAQESTELSSDQWDTVIAADDELTDKLNALSQADDTVAAAAQAGAQAAADDKKNAVKVSRPKQSELDLDNPNESLTMEERFELYLAEAEPAQGELGLDNPNSMGAKLKRGAKAAASKVAGAAKQAGKNLTNKVTADKLMKAWKSAGEPTDTVSIYNILSDAGLDNDAIGKISQENDVDIAPSSNDTQEPTTQEPASPAQDETPPKQSQTPQQTTAPQVDLKSLADQIKKAGVADIVKQQLTKKVQTKQKPRIRVRSDGTKV